MVSSREKGAFCLTLLPSSSCSSPFLFFKTRGQARSSFCILHRPTTREVLFWEIARSGSRAAADVYTTTHCDFHSQTAICPCIYVKFAPPVRAWKCNALPCTKPNGPACLPSFTTIQKKQAHGHCHRLCPAHWNIIAND